VTYAVPDVQAVVTEAFRQEWGREWGRVVAILIRMTSDWDLAEECARDAFAATLSGLSAVHEAAAGQQVRPPSAGGPCAPDAALGWPHGLRIASVQRQRRLTARAQHRQRLAQLLAQGDLLLAGPWADDSGALLILTADGGRVRQVSQDDPYYTTPGVAVLGIRERLQWQHVSIPAVTQVLRPRTSGPAA
jgi:uncharacterized protein